MEKRRGKVWLEIEEMGEVVEGHTHVFCKRDLCCREFLMGDGTAGIQA
jgi:hypothetical protein